MILNFDDFENIILENEDNDKNYCVIFVGGSIGDQHNQTYRYGGMRCSIDEEGLTADEAKEKAKHSNKFLSPGDKKYYHMSYKAVPRSKVKDA